MATNKPNTKEAVIDLLQEMYKHAHRVARIYKNDGNEDMATTYIATACAYHTAKELLTNPNYYEELYKIFHKEDET